MANNTPPAAGFGRPLSGLNNGWNALRSRVGGEANLEEEEPVENGEIQNSNSNVVDENGQGVATDANVTPARRHSLAAVDAAQTLAAMDSNSTKKRQACTPKRPSKKKKTTAPQKPKKNESKKNETPTKTNDSGIVVGHQPRLRTVVNPLEMEEAFKDGCDSDGWEGPRTGTSSKELEQVDQEVDAPMATAKKAPAVVADVGLTEPCHVPIDDATLNKMKVKDIKHELTIRRVQFPKSGPNSKREALLDRLKESLSQKKEVHPVLLEQKDKKSEMDMSAFAVGSAWRELTPDVDVEEPATIQMPEARAPTVPKDERKIPPRPKQQFSRTFQRPQFKGKKVGGPKEAFLKRHYLNVNSLPSEHAEAFFPMFDNPCKDTAGSSFLSMESITRNANMKANLAFVGESTYTDWMGNFSVKEVRQHLGLYVLNGLSPSPGLERKFNPEDKANFNPFVYDNMCGPKKNAHRRLRQFKAFMTLQDPRALPPNRNESPLFKVLPMIKWIQHMGPNSWVCGVDIGLDEQTIGFKGHHVDKLRITYKAEGDGFQCDALCDDGFTFSVFFRNELPPKELLDLGLSPLHARSVWLFNQLQEEYHRVWVDNLCMSTKFCKAGHKSKNKVSLDGVARGLSRGVPPCVAQEAEKEKDAATLRGRVKAAVLEGDDDCPELVAMSVYDTKPVHFISLACEAIQWVVKKRKMWNQQLHKMVEMNFLRINTNDNYNHKMNAVDLSDQLRNHCRFDCWLRQRKWWWAIFLWGFGVLLANAHKCYCRAQEEAGVPKKDWLAHCDFLHQIAVSWIDEGEITPDEILKQHKKKEKEAEREAERAATQQQQQPTTTPTVQSVRTRSRSPTRAAVSPVSPAPSVSPQRHRAVRLSDNSLDATKGALRIRLNHCNKFHGPLPPTAKAPSCASHRHLLSGEKGANSQTRAVFLCRVCDVHLCLQCFNTFHTEVDIVGNKEMLCQKIS